MEKAELEKEERVESGGSRREGRESERVRERESERKCESERKR